MGTNIGQVKRFLLLLCLFVLAFPGIAQTSPSPELGVQALSDAVLYQSEIVLDGHVDYTPDGMVIFTNGNEGMVVLEGMQAPGKPGQHIMVVGYPYKKGNNYHLSVTGYTFLTH